MAAVAIAWSFFAFGAVYVWAAPPLLLLSLSALALGRAWPDPRRLTDACGLAAISVAALQLVPLPAAIVAVVSPDAAAFRSQVDLSPAPGAWHPVSLDPSLTTVSLMLAVSAFALFLTMRHAAPVHGRRLVPWLAWMAIAASLLGMGKAMLAPGGQIYGFWTPRQSNAAPFGAIINRNHFAAWAVVAAGILIGGFMAHCARRYQAGALRARMGAILSDTRGLWLLFSLALLTAALVFTGSRSGFAGLLSTCAAAAVLARRRASRRTLAVAVLAAMVCLTAAATWARPDMLVARLSTQGGELGLRAQIWEATMTMAARYPIAGVGLGAYPAGMTYYQPPPKVPFFNHAHSQYLELASEGGLLLALPLLGFLAAVARAAWRGLGADAGSYYWIRAGASAAFVGLGVLAIWESPFRTPATLMLTAVAAALAAADSAS